MVHPTEEELRQLLHHKRERAAQLGKIVYMDVDGHCVAIMPDGTALCNSAIAETIYSSDAAVPDDID